MASQNAVELHRNVEEVLANLDELQALAWLIGDPAGGNIEAKIRPGLGAMLERLHKCVHDKVNEIQRGLRTERQ